MVLKLNTACGLTLPWTGNPGTGKLYSDGACTYDAITESCAFWKAVLIISFSFRVDRSRSDFSLSVFSCSST